MSSRHAIFALCFLLLAGMLARAALETAQPPPQRPCYKSPLGLAIDKTGQFAYVVLHTADALAVVDLKNNRVVSEISVGRKPYDVALHKGIAYVTCEGDDTLVAVDVAAQKVLRQFKVGQAPRGVAVDPQTGFIRIVCHDAKVLWTQSPTGHSKKELLPPQPEGNFARASNLELTIGQQRGYGLVRRPFGLFTHGQSIFDPQPAPALKQPVTKAGPQGGFRQVKNLTPASKQPIDNVAPERTAFNPTLDIDYSRTSMDMVAHTRARWFTATAHAPDGRIFTNALSFFLNSSSNAAVVLLDEPDKGYPDPTDVVVKLPKHLAGKKSVPLAANGSAAVHPLNGTRVFISSGGADTIVVFDLSKAARHFEANRSFQQLGGFGMSGGFGGWGTHSGGFGISGGFGNGGGIMGGGGNVGSGGRPFHPFPPGNGFLGGSFGGSSGGTPSGTFGWQGGFSGFATFKEDLKASAQYTLARLATQANPRRMALTPDGKTLVVSNHLADSLTLIDTDNLRVLRHISLGGPKPDEARRGEILFHSAQRTFQQQFSCASCHPGGGSDGLAWDTSPMGAGEHLNSRALHGVRDTRPFGWKGESETLADRVKNTMRHVHRHPISDQDASAVAAYLETLDPPRPLPLEAKNLSAISRGKMLFFGKANCTRCHRGPAFTSPSPRAVIADHQAKMTPFDVPSLRGVSRTAPYLHDGRAATLKDIFQQHNPRKRHGLAHELTPGEMDDVVAFLKSL